MTWWEDTDRDVFVRDIRRGDYVTGYGYVRSAVTVTDSEGNKTVWLKFDTAEDPFAYDPFDTLPVRYR